MLFQLLRVNRLVRPLLVLLFRPALAALTLRPVAAATTAATTATAATAATMLLAFLLRGMVAVRRALRSARQRVLLLRRTRRALVGTALALGTIA